jgi:hypothetical protein
MPTFLDAMLAATPVYAVEKKQSPDHFAPAFPEYLCRLHGYRS